jgi:hypothetical protein
LIFGFNLFVHAIHVPGNIYYGFSYAFSAIRSFALRARGFFLSSASDALIGFFVITRKGFVLRFDSKRFSSTR